MPGYVYIMANKRNGTLYTGVASNLPKRVWEHKDAIHDGFTKEHGCKTLVWYAHYEEIEDAIHREKLVKKWHRKWKLRLIEEMNPDCRDLYEQLTTIY
jgi:putative endonuclease